MRESTCCFTGHRPDKLNFGYDESHPDCMGMKRSLEECIGQLIAQGYVTFLNGVAQGSDIFCAEAVLEKKQAYPHIHLIAVVPYRGQERRWPAHYQQRYRHILSQADEVIVLNEHYTRGCMMQRNCYMVDRSSLIVAIYNGESGGTRNTIAYAIKKSLTILWFNPDSKIWTKSYNIQTEEP